MTHIKKILVCGGAGYIGSHMVQRLCDAGHEVTVLDNLSTGHRECVKHAELEVLDLLDFDALQKFFLRHEFACVYHFAAKSVVAESVADPRLYFQNNVQGTANLLEVVRASNCRRIIFSSTAAVYGEPMFTPITESHPLVPVNPYGLTKLMVEKMLTYYAMAHGIASVSLRYFNAAGAWPERGLGEWHEPESHLIPNVLRSAVHPEGPALRIFGSDYATPDGTCVRDYIHVLDLCAAHALAERYLEAHPGAHVFNLGTGRGHSVLEVVRAAEAVTGKPIRHEVVERRAGDPATLVASARRSAELLGFAAQYELIDMVRSAWEWMGQRP